MRSTDELLREALFHFTLAVDYANATADDQMAVDAASMRMSAGIETLNRLDPSVRDQLFGGSWPLMWGMRNRISHGYLLVDPETIRRTAQTDIPWITSVIRDSLA